jgi:alginate O-acetyltransferase complex protein AlgI
MDRTDSAPRRKALLAASLAANLGVLAFFKYYNFFVGSAVDLSRLIGFPLQARVLDIVLPLGISFHTFQAMSYTIDIYRRKLKPAASILDYALYITFFPQLVAGPIVRASEFIPQLGAAKVWKNIDVRGCLVLFMIGFFKKACLSDNISPYIDDYFANPALYNAHSAWLSVLLYTMQIYCDFSGYTDMAIACAGLLGYPMVRNFDFPYFSENVKIFWSRWHISLSSWFRDYVYFPLGGNRGSEWETCRNLMIVMTIAGLWHGAAWTFVLWGVIEGFVLIAYRTHIGPWNRTGALRRVPAPLGVAATYLYWACISMALFRAEGVRNALITMRSLFFFRAPGTQSLPLGLAGVFAAAAAVHYVSYRGWLDGWYRRLPFEAFYFLTGAAALVILAFANPDYAPFIYFQF